MSDAKTILLIDEDPEFLDLAQAVFESNSFRVVRASRVSDGMLLAENELPDVVVLEAMLPDGTQGFHFTWNLRQHPHSKLRDVPIVLVSRIHNTVPFRLSLSDGDWAYGPGEFLPAQGFLDKPVEPEELLARVRGVLGLG